MSTGQLDQSLLLPQPSRPGGHSLDDPLKYLKGVGGQSAAALGKLDLRSVRDLLRHVPRRWDDRTRFRSVSDVQNGETVSLRGIVTSTETKRPKPRITVTEVILNDNGAALKLVWFNQPYLEKSFKTLAAAKKTVIVYGQVKRAGWTPEIQNPEWEELSEEGDNLSAARIVPVYPSTAGLRQTRLRHIIHEGLQRYSHLLAEPLEPDILLRHRLIGVQTAVRQIHFPDSFADLEAARTRLVFEEFYLLQVLLAVRRIAGAQRNTGLKFSVDTDWLASHLRDIVPFELTAAQQRTIGEIRADLCSGRSMNRLLQGDVGSGKTIVGLAAMLMAVENGCQAALMAPTEILAQQHAIELRHMLDPIGMAVELSIGSQTAKEKREIRARIAGGQSSIVIGTHALIQEGVEFARLGLVIVDEQHRFGVLQRQALAQKGEKPHVLVMTATPIPRTLTLTLYGDLEVSVLDELPPGRKPITTHWKSHNKRSQIYSAAERLLRAGRQVYVVCPLIEESEKLQAMSAIGLAEQISADVFPQYRVGLLHGQMKSDEKDEVMAQFKAHKLDILVSTTVIEVGIDVPNATVIIVEDADRFGLAQLHQLRGRVGRGTHASFCILVAEPTTDVGKARMEIMMRTVDGFVIAEEDLKLRGPGEFYGTRQSGMPEFYIADIVRDIKILEETRDAATLTLESDPLLARPEHAELSRAISRLRPGYDLMTVS